MRILLRTLWKKRGDTLAGTIEELYHIELGVRSDKVLRNVMRDDGVESLNNLFKKKRRGRLPKTPRDSA